MFKDHVEVPGLDKEKSKLDDLINQMRYFKDFIKKTQSHGCDIQSISASD